MPKKLFDSKKHNHIPWLKLLVEAGLVVLSVLLALILNNWRQDQINNDLAQKAVQNLQREIKENKAEVERAYKYHLNLLQKFSSKNPPTGIETKDAIIQNNAWNTAQSMGAIPYIDFSIVAIASSIQETQRQYQNVESVTNAIMLLGNFGAGGENFPMKRLPKGLNWILQELTSIEKILLKQYEKALKMIG